MNLSYLGTLLYNKDRVYETRKILCIFGFISLFWKTLSEKKLVYVKLNCFESTILSFIQLVILNSSFQKLLEGWLWTESLKIWACPFRLANLFQFCKTDTRFISSYNKNLCILSSYVLPLGDFKISVCPFEFCKTDVGFEIIEPKNLCIYNIIFSYVYFISDFYTAHAASLGVSTLSKYIQRHLHIDTV